MKKAKLFATDELPTSYSLNKMHSPHFTYLEYASIHNKPFVSYRLPKGEEHITLILNENSAKEFHNYEEIASKRGFIFTPFDTEKNKNLFIIPEEIIIGNKGFRGDLFLDKTVSQNHSTLAEIDESKQTYQQQFEQLHQLLKKGDLEKVILSRTLTLAGQPKDENVYTYYNLAENYPNAMVYWVHLPHLGVEWIGATPELLVQQSDKDLQTLALAGTKKADEAWTEKEKQEQQMVADYISYQLKDYQPIKSKTETINTGVVQHIATHFTLPNASVNLFPIIEKLHPTPAICGLPKTKAFETIRQTETHDRLYYCGILGAVNIAGQTATFVNLRCMQLAKDKVRLFVGGGLTKDSDLEREWQETERKADTLRNFLL